MKLRGSDGVVRNFSVSRCDGDLINGVRQEGFKEAQCTECGMGFGVHDTRVLKPRFKAHSCKETTANA